MFYTFGRKTCAQNTLDSTVQKPPLTFQNRRIYTQKCFFIGKWKTCTLHLLTSVFENVSQHISNSHRSQLFASVSYYYYFFKNQSCFWVGVLASLLLFLFLVESVLRWIWTPDYPAKRFPLWEVQETEMCENHKDDVQSHLSSCS